MSCGFKLNSMEVSYTIPDELLNEEKIWECPHTTPKDEDNYCIFHQSLNEKDNTDLSSKLVNLTKNNNSIYIFQPKFNTLELENLEINCDVMIKGSTFKDILKFSNITLNSAFELTDSDFESDVIIDKLTSNEKLNFEYSKFYSSVICTRNTFNSTVNFSYSVFTDFLKFTNNISKATVDFNSSAFKKYSIFNYSSFRKLKFNSTKFYKSAEFNNTSIWKSEFKNVEFLEDVGFQESIFKVKANFEDVKFMKDVSFLKAKFYGDIIFKNSDFKEKSSFIKADFTGNVYFYYSTLKNGLFNNLNLENVSFENTDLGKSIFIGSDLRRTNLKKSVLENIRIDSDTRFITKLDDSTNIYKEEGNLKESLDFYFNNKYNHSISTYRSLEELGKRKGLLNLQDTAFVRQKDMLKKELYKKSFGNNPILVRIGYFFKYLRLNILRKLMKYGESTRRIIFWICATIIVSGTLRFLNKCTVFSYENIQVSLNCGSNVLTESVYYAGVSFTSVGLKSEIIETEPLFVLGNSILGAILISLFVFVLGRKATK